MLKAFFLFLEKEKYILQRVQFCFFRKAAVEKPYTFAPERVKHFGMRRKIQLAAAAAVMAAAVWSGCSRENNLPNMEEQYGNKDTVKIDLNFKLSGIESRSEAEVNEVLLEDVNVFVADELGSVIYKGYHTSAVDLEIEAYENMLYSVYAIANAGEALDGRNVEEIEGLVYSIPDISQITSPNGAVLMSGKTDPQILAAGEGRSVTVYLTRCIAKVQLTADYSQLNDDVEITVTKVQLKNVPSCVNIFGESKITQKGNSMDGDVVFRPSATDLSRGLVFYQFENLQGTLQPRNTTQQEKQWSSSNPYSDICSYIELKATYSSPRKYGDILYRFYLGTDMVTNYDIKRNTQLNITVSFINDGGVDENTWRVDNSNIVDCVSNITLSPSSLEFTELGETKGITATVLPVTAPNKTLEWHSSDETVATADEAGYVTSIGNGECTISVCSTDGSNITSYCSVTVNYKEPEKPVDPPAFTRTPGEMYHGQREMIAFEKEVENIGTLSATSSNPSVVKIVGTTAEGIEVMAIAPGEATIYAGINGNYSTECKISVVELKILPDNSSITMYNHFYEEIGYSISPSWAAKDFKVEMSSSSNAVQCGFDGLENRVIPQYAENASLPANGAITLQLQGRDDVQATVEFTVKPSLTMVESMQVNANLGNSDAIKSLGLDTHPRANVEFSWAAEDNIYYGNPGDWNVYISAKENRILFPIPNSANGLYRLTASVKGDDGYGENSSEGVKYCDITVYETVYLVGISKTVDRNRVSGQKDTWDYENEVVAAWLSHPNSLIYPQGEVDLELPYKFNGATYTDTHPGITETFRFTFEKGETLNMPLGTGSFTYNGTAPLYYISYFKLTPAGSQYVEGNKASGQPYVYVYSRSFMNGFSDDAKPKWEKIFELVYPK